MSIVVHTQQKCINWENVFKSLSLPVETTLEEGHLLYNGNGILSDIKNDFRFEIMGNSLYDWRIGVSYDLITFIQKAKNCDKEQAHQIAKSHLF